MAMSVALGTAVKDNMPPLAIVLHWLPKPSETFIYDEISLFRQWAVPFHVFTLYGPWPGRLSPAMSDEHWPITRLGSRAVPRLMSAVGFWLKANGPVARQLWRTIPWRRWGDLETTGENLWAFLCGFHIGRQVREMGAGHIHAPWANGPATAAWVASRLTGLPFSFSAWAGDIFPPDGALADKIRDSSFVRCTCRTFLHHLQQQELSSSGKIRVLLNGQDPARFDPVERLHRPPWQLLGLGRFVAKKGFADALRAAAQLKEKGLDFHLTLAGDGPERRRLERLARSLGLDGHVSFPGFMPRHQAGELFRTADILLMPSVVDPAGDRDGIPNVIMEALLCGIPVIASATGAIGELIRDGDTGRLVPPGRPEALADAVLELIAHPAAARALAARGREAVQRDHNLETNTRLLLELIAQHSKSRNAR